MPPFSFPAQLPSLFFEPKRYRPHGIGYWSGHIPFACDLIHTLRPSIFVELGTHTGESYFAFCQAISESNTRCRSFAVDTWRGDRHTGAYSDQVFREVAACNTEYGRFSTLLRETFDAASGRFTSGSIDLLHIDGAHTYEAVRHDFDIWWPKVKPGGVVLMHDSFERGHDFGVWRLLAELQTRYPATEFTHSHGLGVICKPPLHPTHIAAAFAGSDESARAGMRRYYETCAAKLSQIFFERNRRFSDWEVTSQLFWKTDAGDYTEEASIRTAEVIGAEGTQIVLPIPPESAGYRGFRLAVSLTPALIAVQSLAIRNVGGHETWRQNAHESISAWRQGGLRVYLDDTRAVLTSVPAHAQFELPIPAETLKALRVGGDLLLNLSGLSPFEVASLLPSD